MNLKFNRNYSYYKTIVKAAKFAFQEHQLEKSIKIASIALEFGTSNYCNFYTDTEIEIILNKIGCSLLPEYFVAGTNPENFNIRVLHYASVVTNIGGHTRLLSNWISEDNTNLHSIFLGRQNEEIPQFIVDVIGSNNSSLYVYSDNVTFSERVEALYEIVKDYDLVVLHHHPDDVIPVIAFARAGMPPVAILNHGDHKAWVGSSICDNLIEIRDNLIPYDIKRRLVNEFSVLPIPIGLPEQGGYEESRAALGISRDEIILLTVGAEYKYKPFNNKNFFEDIIEVLDKSDLAKLFIVGVSPVSAAATKYNHPQIVYVSATPDLEVYKRACDIYVEGYPFSSFTAYFEVGILKKPIHFMYEAPILNQYSLKNYNNQHLYYQSKLEWYTSLLSLINNPEERIRQAENIYQDILDNHVSLGWKNYLFSFYENIRNKHHSINLSNYDALILTDNELYLDKILHHRVVNAVEDIDSLSFFNKVILIKDLFIVNDYFDLMFSNSGIYLINEVTNWPLLFRIGFLFRAFVSKKISPFSYVKEVLSKLKHKIY